MANATLQTKQEFHRWFRHMVKRNGEKKTVAHIHAFEDSLTGRCRADFNAVLLQCIRYMHDVEVMEILSTQRLATVAEVEEYFSQKKK